MPIGVVCHNRFARLLIPKLLPDRARTAWRNARFWRASFARPGSFICGERGCQPDEFSVFVGRLKHQDVRDRQSPQKVNSGTAIAFKTSRRKADAPNVRNGAGLERSAALQPCPSARPG
jgi:hypothetical protein